MPRFTVVIPTHNRPVALESAVLSVLGQTFGDFELFVVDDGSSDSTRDVVQAFADPRVRYVRQSHGGVSSARNNGIVRAEGDLIAFLDDDDEVLPRWLESFSSLLARPDCHVARCGLLRIGEKGMIRRVVAPGDPDDFEQWTSRFLAGTFALRTELLRALGGYDESLFFGENSELAMRLWEGRRQEGWSIGTSEDVLIHAAVSDTDSYSDARSRMAEYVLGRHQRLFAAHPDSRSAYLAIIGVEAARAGDFRKARRFLRKSWAARPWRFKSLARLIVAALPRIGRAVWGERTSRKPVRLALSHGPGPGNPQMSSTAARARRRVVLVSHEASRTGAPRVAVDILKGLSGMDLERVAVVRWPGPLNGELDRDAERLILEPLRRTRVVLRRFRRTRRLATRLEEAVAGRLLRRLMPSVVYLNTVKSACYVRPATAMGIPVVLHVHESEPLASQTLARYRLDDLWDRIRLVACSKEVRDNLVRITGVSEEQIPVLRSAVDVDRMQVLALEGDPFEGERGFVVGACGTPDRRKGIDLWLEMVRHARDRNGRARFVWVGGEATDEIRGDIRRLGLEGAVEFVASVDNPHPWIARFDVFTLTSRADPFPLVVLEAMSLGRPVVAFDVGGVREQLGDPDQLVVPGAADAMASAVSDLLAAPERRRLIGERNRRRVRERFGIESFRHGVKDLVGGQVGAS